MLFYQNRNNFSRFNYFCLLLCNNLSGIVQFTYYAISFDNFIGLGHSKYYSILRNILFGLGQFNYYIILSNTKIGLGAMLFILHMFVALVIQVTNNKIGLGRNVVYLSLVYF